MEISSIKTVAKRANVTMSSTVMTDPTRSVDRRPRSSGNRVIVPFLRNVWDRCMRHCGGHLGRQLLWNEGSSRAGSTMCKPKPLHVLGRFPDGKNFVEAVCA